MTVESETSLHITHQLKMKGDLSCSLPVTLSTSYIGKIKTKKSVVCDATSELQGGIRSQTLKIEAGAKIHADIQIGTHIPLWLKFPFFFSFKKASPAPYP